MGDLAQCRNDLGVCRRELDIAVSHVNRNAEISNNNLAAARRFESERNAYYQQLQTMIQERNNAHQIIQQLNNTVANLQSQLRNGTTSNHDLQRLKSEIDDKKREINNLKHENENIKNKNRSLEHDIIRLRSMDNLHLNNMPNHEKLEYENKIRKLDALINEKSEDLRKMTLDHEEKLKKLNDHVIELETHIKTLKTENDSLKINTNDNSQITKLIQENKDLKDEIDRLKSNSNNNNDNNQVEKLKEIIEDLKNKLSNIKPKSKVKSKPKSKAKSKAKSRKKSKKRR